MRHKKSGTKLGRSTSHKKMMLRNMVTSLFENERIVTTEPKAKAARSLADKMITLAKRGDLHARRQALSFLTKKEITHKLFDQIKERYMERAGGYTSIVKIGPRRGDNAEMAVLELINPEEREKAGKKKAKRKRGPRKKSAASTATAKETQVSQTSGAQDAAAPAAGPQEEPAPQETASVETPAEPEAATEADVETTASEDDSKEKGE